MILCALRDNIFVRKWWLGLWEYLTRWSVGRGAAFEIPDSKMRMKSVVRIGNRCRLDILWPAVGREESKIGKTCYCCHCHLSRGLTLYGWWKLFTYTISVATVVWHIGAVLVFHRCDWNMWGGDLFVLTHGFSPSFSTQLIWVCGEAECCSEGDVG